MSTVPQKPGMPISQISHADMVTIFEMARWGLVMEQDAILNQLDISEAEYVRLRDEVLLPFLGVHPKARSTAYRQ